MQEETVGLNDMQDYEEIQVEDFIPYKEYPVGGYFRIGKEVFKVVSNPYYCCSYCDINATDHCFKMACDRTEREDEDSVQFILYDTEE